MKKNTITGFLLLLSVLYAGLAFAGENAGAPTSPPVPDVRNVRWGMSREEVIAAEKTGLLPLADSFLLSQKETMHGLDFSLAYMFADDRLVSVIAFYAGEKTAMNIYKQHYRDFSERMTEAFGKPVSQQLPSEKSLNNPLLALRATENWENERTKAVMMLAALENGASFRIVYRTAKFSKEDAAAIEKTVRESMGGGMFP